MAGFGGFGAGKMRRKNPLRHESMRMQFAPPNSGNKALRIHQRLNGTHTQPEKSVPARIRMERPRERRPRAEQSEKGSEA